MSKYFSKTGLSVSDGSDADAPDINNVVNETDAAFEQVAQDVTSIGTKAQEYAENEPGVPVIPGEYSAKHWSYLSEQWAVGTPVDNSLTPTGDKSAETLAGEAASSAEVAQGASVSAVSAANAALSYSNSANASANNAINAASAAQVAQGAAEAAQTLAEDARDAAQGYALSASNSADEASDNADLVEAWTLETQGYRDEALAAETVVTALVPVCQANADYAEAQANAAEGYALDAQSAVCQDLQSIYTSLLLVDDVVSVFRYDTSKDSDGGAWRYRCSDKSWENEALGTATRGTTRRFPAVVDIVAQADTVTIFDVTTPTPEMWMVFNKATNNMGISFADPLGFYVSSIGAINGVLVIGLTYDSGSAGSLNIIDFVRDTGVAVRNSASYVGDYLGGVSERNDAKGFTNTPTLGLAGEHVNDVAMTVLDDAPVDIITGLPVPTIAVATNGGVSVIDGPAGVDTVVDSSNVTIIDSVGFRKDNALIVSYLSYVTITEDYSADGFTISTLYADFSYTTGVDLHFLGDVADRPYKAIEGAVYSSAGSTLLKENPSDPSEGMVAYITDSYNTGWMQGDIKGAFLADTVEETIGVDVTSELVENGVIDDEYGWTFYSSGWTIGSGTLQVATSGSSGIQETIPSLTIGNEYRAQLSTVSHSLGNTRLHFGADSTFTITGDSVGIHTIIGEADGTDGNFWLYSTDPYTATLDDIWVWEAGDEEVTNGTIDDEYNWTTGSFWTIGSGKASIDGTQLDTETLQGAMDLVNGNTYRSQVSVTRLAGAFIPSLGSGLGESKFLTGIYTDNMLAGGSLDYIGYANLDFNGSVDDIWLWEAGAETVTGFANYPSAPFETLEFTGNSVTSAINDAGAGGFFSTNKLGLTVGKVYEIEIDVTLNSGVMPTVSTGSYNDNSIGDIPPGTYLTSGINQITFKYTGTTADTDYVWFAGDSAGSDISATVSVREITDVIENGEFSRDDGSWILDQGTGTVSISGGKLSIVGNGYARQAAMTIGKTYIVQLEMSNFASAAGGSLSIYDGTFHSRWNTDGIHSVVFEATGPSLYVTAADDNLDSCDVDNVKLYEAELVNGTWQPVGNLIVNPSFEGWLDDAKWIDSSSGDAYTSTSGGDIYMTRVDSSNITQFYQEFITVPGDMYELSFDIATSGSGVTVIVENGNGGTDIFVEAGVEGSALFTFKAEEAITSLRYFLSANGATGTVNNISVRKITDIIENGEFSRKDTWFESTATYTVSGGVATVTLTATNGTIVQAIPTEIGKHYIVQGVATDGTGIGRIYFGSDWMAGNGAAPVSKVFEAVGTSTNVSMLVVGGIGDTANFSDVKVYEAEQVNGTWQPVGNLIVNPSFEGWLDDTEWSDTRGEVATYEGNLILTTTVGGVAGAASQSIECVAGGTYEITFDIVTGGTITYGIVRIGHSAFDGSYLNESANTGVGSYTYTFIATYTGTHYLTMFCGAGTAGNSTVYNNISVKRIQNLVENGEFSSDRVWETSTSGAASISGGVGSVDGSQTVPINAFRQNNLMVVGQKYLLKASVTRSAGTYTFFAGSGASYGPYSDATLDLEIVVVCTTDSTLFLQCDADFIGTFDNVELYELSEADRSYNDNPLQVVGQLEKTAINGGELVEYSGFSEEDYLEQPYNSDLDVGTGDFYYSIWFEYETLTDFNYLIERMVPGDASVYFFLRVGVSGDVQVAIGSVVLVGSQTIPAGKRTKITALRRSGSLYLYADTTLIGSQVDGSTQTGGEQVVRVGVRAYDGSDPVEGTVALFKVGAGAPSADQIKFMYDQEKHLFEGTKCTLQGSSSDVLDLSYDSRNDEYFVGTDVITKVSGLVTEEVAFEGDGNMITLSGVDYTRSGNEFFLPAKSDEVTFTFGDDMTYPVQVAIQNDPASGGYCTYSTQKSNISPVGPGNILPSTGVAFTITGPTFIKVAIDNSGQTDVTVALIVDSGDAYLPPETFTGLDAEGGNLTIATEVGAYRSEEAHNLRAELEEAHKLIGDLTAPQQEIDYLTAEHPYELPQGWYPVDVYANAGGARYFRSAWDVNYDGFKYSVSLSVAADVKIVARRIV